MVLVCFLSDEVWGNGKTRFGLSPKMGHWCHLFVRFGRHRRLPKMVSGLPVPIPERMQLVIWIVSVSAVAVGLVRLPSPM